MQEAFWYVTTEKLRVRLINNLADISKRRVGFLQGHSPLFTHIMSAPTQDMPPSGGYSQVRYRRYLPKRGPSGAVIIAGVTAFCTFGFYRVAQGNLERRCVFYNPLASFKTFYKRFSNSDWHVFHMRYHRELKRENLWSRIHLIPLLTAESDRDMFRRTVAAKDREAEIMKDVKDWKAGESVYNNTKYFTPPSYVIVPEDN